MVTKTIILRFRAINRDTFEAIRNDAKKVETRAATERYNNIKAGDKIIFVCGKERFEKDVVYTEIFKTISALSKKYKVKEIHPGLETENELIKMYHSFPGYKEKIKKFGLIALELK